MLPAYGSVMKVCSSLEPVVVDAPDEPDWQVIADVAPTLPNRYLDVAVPLRPAYRTKIERAIEGSGEHFEDFAADTGVKPKRV